MRVNIFTVHNENRGKMFILERSDERERESHVADTVSGGGICAAKIVTIGSAGLLKYCVQF